MHGRTQPRTPARWVYYKLTLSAFGSGELKMELSIKHGVQRRSFFCIFEIIVFCFVVAICDLVHALEAMYGLP